MLMNNLHSMNSLCDDAISYKKSRVKYRRKISKNPQKILDAPGLQDDYYLNLMDWSSQNMLAIGLENTVYLWNGKNGGVEKLCDLQDFSFDPCSPSKGT